MAAPGSPMTDAFFPETNTRNKKPVAYNPPSPKTTEELSQKMKKGDTYTNEDKGYSIKNGRVSPTDNSYSESERKQALMKRAKEKRDASMRKK